MTIGTSVCANSPTARGAGSPAPRPLNEAAPANKAITRLTETSSASVSSQRGFHELSCTRTTHQGEPENES